MKVLTEKDILHIWEAGQNRPLWFKAMLILARAFPGKKRSQLADMTIGQRNFHLLKLRQRMVGSSLDSLVRCPECREPMEFKMNVEGMFGIAPAEEGNPQFSTVLQGITLRFRALTSRDLAAMSESHDPHTARTVLLDRCILQAAKDETPLDKENIPGAVIEALGEKMAETYDPHVEIRFALECPACRHNWSAVFDIVSFFWWEIESQAQRLLQEAHILARAYGWSEKDIFVMNASRKQYYLELVS